MIFDEMDRQELRTYVDFLMRHYRVVDAFWYIYVEEEQGSAVADHFNERVWDRAASLGARDILKRFGIEERGLEGFVKALKYFPWTIIVGYHIEHKDDEVIVTVPECPAQRGRLDRNLGEYACKEMHRGEFISFCREIDPAIRVECVHAPPDPHPEGLFCTWRFTMDEGSARSSSVGPG